MSKEIIEKIKEAEAEANRIRQTAAEQAKERVRHAEEVGALLCNKIEEDAAQENAEKLRLTREKAKELRSRTERDARTEAEQVIAAAEVYMADAVRMIIGGIMEQCQ